MAEDGFFSPCGKDNRERERETEKQRQRQRNTERSGKKKTQMETEKRTDSHKLCTFSLTIPRKLSY